MILPIVEVPTGYGSRRCPVCQQRLLCTPHSERCEHGHYVHATMPRPMLGEIFGFTGQPWARLANPHKHGLVDGWRSSYMSREKLER